MIGSAEWPRERAVEVRDAIAAVARGHSQVVLIHAARRHPDTSRLLGVDAWTELTAERLGHQVEHQQLAPEETSGAPGVDVVVAFPLENDPDTAAAIARAEAAGLAVLTHTA